MTSPQIEVSPCREWGRRQFWEGASHPPVPPFFYQLCLPYFIWNVLMIYLKKGHIRYIFFPSASLDCIVLPEGARPRVFFYFGSMMAHLPPSSSSPKTFQRHGFQLIPLHSLFMSFSCVLPAACPFLRSRDSSRLSRDTKGHAPSFSIIGR